jgi:CRP-like cAMP-binding protein
MITVLQHTHSSRGLDLLLAKLNLRDELSLEEKTALLAAAGEAVTYAPGTDMVLELSSPNHSLLVVSGLAASYNIVETGERQITAFHIAGDFVDLHSLFLRKLDCSVSALTDVVAVQFAHVVLQRVTADYPRLARTLWTSTIMDAAVRRQWLVAMGRMCSTAHMAHLLCEQFLRSRAVGLGSANSFPFEVTQVQLGDAMGLSTVHVNRTLQELRRRALLEWEHGIVTVLDWEGLQQAGQFDPAYLDIG